MQACLENQLEAMQDDKCAAIINEYPGGLSTGIANFSPCYRSSANSSNAKAGGVGERAREGKEKEC